MNISISDTSKDLVFKLDYDFGFPADILVSKMESETWQGESYYRSLNTNRNYGGRLVLEGASRGKLSADNIKDPALRTIFEYVTSQRFKMQILEKLFLNESFLRLWGIKNIYLFDRLTTLTANLVIDQPGCNIKIHLDNRMLVGTGMLYLNEIPPDNGFQSTVFYSDNKGSNPVTMEAGFGNGWFAVNMQDNWHEGFNNSNYKRYSILLGLELNIEHLKRPVDNTDVNIDSTKDNNGIKK